VRDLLALEIALHQLVGVLGDLVQKFLAVLLRLALQLIRDLDLAAVLTLAALVLVALHVHEIDDAAYLVLAADRNLRGHYVGPEGLLERVERAEEVGALAIEHVHEHEPGHAELLRAVPQPRGRDFRAHHGVHDEDRALAHAQCGDRVGDEARVTGSVNEVDLAVIPVKRGEARADRHLARLLVGRRVGNRGSVCHRAKAVERTRLEQEGLVERGLPAASVAD
jgi:hypothetical protein